MDLYLLNESGKRIAVLSEYNALIWTTKMTQTRVGLNLPLSAEGLVEKACYLQRDDSDVVAQIFAKRSNYGDKTLALEAFDPIELLRRRVNFWTRSLAGRREALVVALVNAALRPAPEIGQGIARRPNLWGEIVDRQVMSPGLSELTSAQVSWGDCYLEVCKLLEGTQIRLATSFERGTIVPTLTEGSDLSRQVIFSIEDGDLSEVVHSRVDEGVCNIAVVSWSAGNTDQVLTVQKDLDVTHGELWVDGSSVANADQSSGSLMAALHEHGKTKLFSQAQEHSLTGVLSQARFEYGKDYCVGDRVGYRTASLKGSDVITEVEEVFAGGKKTVAVTVGKSYPTIRQIVERRTS